MAEGTRCYFQSLNSCTLIGIDLSTGSSLKVLNNFMHSYGVYNGGRYKFMNARKTRDLIAMVTSDILRLSYILKLRWNPIIE